MLKNVSKKRKILPQRFFNRPTEQVAKELLGKCLVRRVGKKEYARMITDVEAYIGVEDKASHASRGKTPRTEVMFGEAGCWYVYLIYGVHYCLNVVTEKKNYPAAVLIRGVEGITGPGRVTRAFHINKRINTQKAIPKSGLWIEDRGVVIRSSKIVRGKRIGVDYAGTWKHRLWRFYISEKDKK